jgi:predicted HicB family RNase H-like nuclease
MANTKPLIRDDCIRSRVKSELKAAAQDVARRNNESLSTLVERALEREVER